MQCDGSTPAHRYLHRLNRMHPQCLSKLHGIYPFVHAISSDRSPSHSLHPPEVSTPLPSAPRNIHTQTESRFHTSFRSANQRFHRSTTWDIRFRGQSSESSFRQALPQIRSTPLPEPFRATYRESVRWKVLSGFVSFSIASASFYLRPAFRLGSPVSIS